MLTDKMQRPSKQNSKLLVWETGGNGYHLQSKEYRTGDRLPREDKTASLQCLLVSLRETA